MLGGFADYEDASCRVRTPFAGRRPGIMGKRRFYETQFAFVLLLRRDNQKVALPDGLPIFL